MTVQEMLAMPDQRLPAGERDRIRARLEAGRRGDGRQDQAPDPGPGPGRRM